MANFVPGLDLGHIRLEALLGKGGMGEVWKAQDQKLQRTVAVKTLAHSGESAAARHLFVREAQAAAALSHPHIANIFDVGESKGTVYFVMEYLDGTSLRQVLSKEGRFELQRWFEVALALARGVAHAHDSHIVHRDLKPDNVMLTRQGGIKILDFGIAKRVEHLVLDLEPALARAREAAKAKARLETDADEQGDTMGTSSLGTSSLGATGAAPTEPSHELDNALDSYRSRVGGVTGTPDYMSPEQTYTNQLDGRTDIFSLGIVLYEMLAGQNPFRKSTVGQTLQAIEEEEPQDLALLRPQLPREVTRLVHRCLRKKLGERFQTMAEVVRALEQAEAKSRTLGARARSSFYGLGRGQRMALAAVIGLLVAGTAVGTGTLARKYWHQQQARSVKNARTIALLALEDRTGTPESGTLTHGTWLDLQIQIQQVPGLRLLWQSVQESAWTKQDLPRLARELGVGMYLSGWVRYDGGERLRMAVSLRDLATDREWLQWEVTGQATDYLRLRAAVPHEVAALLGVPIAKRISKRLWNANTQRGDSMVAHLGILGALPGDPAALHRTTQALEEVLQHDPGFALGYASLAEKQATLGLTAPGYLSRAEANARKAIALDSDCWFAPFALATVLNHQNQSSAARSALERSLRLFPQNVPSEGNLAVSLSDEGRWLEALTTGAQVFYLAPHNAIAESLSYTQFLLYLCTVELCDAWFRQQAETDRTGFGMLFSSRWLIQHGKIEESLQLLSRAVERNLLPDFVRPALLQVQVLANRADPNVLAERARNDPTETLNDFLVGTSWRQVYVYWLREHGRKEEAVPLLEQDLAGAQKTLAEQPGLQSALLQAAGASALQGKLDDAATWLERAYDAGYVKPAEVRAAPVFAKLSEHPAGQKILSKMDAKIAQMRKEAQAQGLFDFAAVTSGEWAEKRGAAYYAEE